MASCTPKSFVIPLVEAALAWCASSFNTTRFTGPPTPAAPDVNYCLQTTDDAIDIALRVITEVQCR